MPATVTDPRQSHDSAQIRVATIALHTEHENTRNLQEVRVSQRRTLFISCGLAISSCELTSIPVIRVITATALDKSCKWPKWRHFIEVDIQPHFILFFVTDNILEYTRRQKTGIGEQSYVVQPYNGGGNEDYNVQATKVECSEHSR